MLENPGLPGSGLITNSLFCGLQTIGPGETAPAHRHSPNALRLIIESNGAYTTVAGERVVMHRGDLVLTPGWAWHGHGHVGSKPAIWLDALDLFTIFIVLRFAAYARTPHVAGDITASLLQPELCRP
jgi:gentisate 1,2-dioxygenase